jgi:hypothetical protein
MATSPLFGWEEPDDTDLVKDGAAAIRTLGNAIDTSMGDLLGGTSGQVLSKNSNTNMDFTWVTPDDANAIQNAIVDAKGDLIAATAADTPSRLAVGANNTSLVANSSEATGLEWQGAWQAWTPTLTNLTVGNGTQTARYQQIGKTVNFDYRFVFGSTSSIAFAPSITLPVNIVRNSGSYPLKIEDAGVGDYFGFVDVFNNAFYPSVGVTNGAYLQIAYLNSTVPITFNTGDAFAFRGSYEAA